MVKRYERGPVKLSARRNLKGLEEGRKILILTLTSCSTKTLKFPVSPKGENF